MQTTAQQTETYFNHSWLSCFTVLLCLCLFITSCALSSRIPGGAKSYCMSSKWTQEFIDTVKKAEYSYYRFKNRSIVGNDNVCAFGTEFSTLDIRWETKEGVKREEHLDLNALVEKMKQEQRPEGGFPEADSTKIYITIVDEKLELTYYIFHQSLRENRLFTRRYYYTLYTSNSNAGIH